MKGIIRWRFHHIGAPRRWCWHNNRWLLGSIMMITSWISSAILITHRWPSPSRVWASWLHEVMLCCVAVMLCVSAGVSHIWYAMWWIVLGWTWHDPGKQVMLVRCHHIIMSSLPMDSCFVCRGLMAYVMTFMCHDLYSCHVMSYPIISCAVQCCNHVWCAASLIENHWIDCSCPDTNPSSAHPPTAQQLVSCQQSSSHNMIWGHNTTTTWDLCWHRHTRWSALTSHISHYHMFPSHVCLVPSTSSSDP